jgi:hypothetical protein
MIVKRELMEGNLIRHIPTGEIKVVSWGGYLKEDEYEPIPLTHELLEKYGFYKQVDKTCTGFAIYCTSETGMKLLVDEYETPFSNIEAYYEKYFGEYSYIGRRHDLKIHQLQNLYRTLVGKDLPEIINQ